MSISTWQFVCLCCQIVTLRTKLTILLQTFPDIDDMYKQRTLTRLLEKEQWAVAATFAGQDIQCQVTNLTPLVYSKTRCCVLQANIADDSPHV